MVILILSRTCQQYAGYLYSGTDLRIGKIGHGLGPRTFGGPAQLFLWRLNIS